MVTMLIDHGAIADKANNMGWTPLFAAAQVGSDSLATSLYVAVLLLIALLEL